MNPEAIADAAWEVIREQLRSWPGAKRLTADELDAYIKTFRDPYGRGRPRCDPPELELLIDDLIAADVDGKRPPVGVILRELADRRGARVARVDRPTFDLAAAEPAAPWVVAHSNATGSQLAPLMRAAAVKAGHDPHPVHLRESCDLCEVDRLTVTFEREQLDELGAAYRQTTEYEARREAFDASLDARFPWRGGGA